MRNFINSISGAASVEAVLVAGLIGTAIVAGSAKMNDEDQTTRSQPALISAETASISK